MKHLLTIRILIILFATIGVLVACNRQNKGEETHIAVFIPGILEGSPTYEMMNAGVRKAIESTKINVKTIEGGFDQATWLSQVTTLASEERYNLIITSNAAMSEICAATVESFPNQQFLVFDGSGLGGPMVSEIIYNHTEQAYLAGRFAGLVTISTEMKRSNADLKVGMIVAQEYPQMNQEIRPGFEMGLHSVNPDIELNFRVLGNWYDAEMAKSLANGLIHQGVDIILAIAGGAGEGVVAAAKESKVYVVWFDEDISNTAPGTVLASSILLQEKAARKWTRTWIEGSLEPGTRIYVGVKEGYVDFPLDTRNARRYIPESLKEQMAMTISQLEETPFIER